MFLHFDYHPELLARIRAWEGATWSQSHKAWHMAWQPDILPKLEAHFQGIATLDTRPIETVAGKVLSSRPELWIGGAPVAGVQQQLELFLAFMRQKRYSESTITSYLKALRVFFVYFQKEASAITNEDLTDFNNHLAGLGISFSFQNQLASALKLFYEKVEDRRLDIEKIERPLPEHKLPNVLSQEEVRAVLCAPSNIKHRAMLALIYGCGLRRSELLKLKLTDVDSGRGMLIVRNAKGRKDRLVPVSEKQLELLREYYKSARPEQWLFEGQRAGSPYSAQSLQSVMQQAVKKARVKKPASLHWLRHSYATHLMEKGIDLRYIQALLGHKSSKTTEIYTHVSRKSLQNISSPFDDL